LLILKKVKVVCFVTLLQVLIWRDLGGMEKRNLKIATQRRIGEGGNQASRSIGLTNNKHAGTYHEGINQLSILQGMREIKGWAAQGTGRTAR
jgi:hypothetical protein